MLPFNMGVGGDTGGVDTGDIGHSLRFRSAANAYLSRTPASSGNLKTWTMSMWVKRGTLSTGAFTLFGTGANNTNDTICYFGPGGTGDQLDIIVRASSVVQGRLTTNQLFRDPTSHTHVVFVYDSPQVTAADRMKLFINGVRVTSFATETQPAQNTDTLWNTARALYLGRLRDDSPNYLDGYLSRVCFVDGQALTPSSFGYLNTEINEWVSKSQSAVKAVVDAGGTNSFMLDFDDATSLTTLGYDKSTKGNNWTLNNFSLTAGSTYDHMLDVPGNSFQTMSPINSSLPSGVVDGNLKVYVASGALDYVHASAFAVSSGVWWYEVESLAYAAGSAAIGVFRAGGNIATGGYSNANFYGYLNSNGNKLNAASVAYGTGWSTVGDKIGCLMDFTSGTLSITFYKKVTGTWTSQGVAYSGLTGEFYPACMCYNGNSLAFTFGQSPFDNATPPSSAKALCQANLPDVAILNPKLHFDINTRTGTAATYSVTGLGFQPDLVWSKSRGRAVDHALYDSVRGVQKQLESNSTGAETTETTGLTAFNSDGYTGGALDQINGTTATNSFVDWLWKAGGAAVSNTAGSITSQVSANVEAGFSIVTYTGTGANATVGHGLGKAPGLVIVKNRSNGAGRSWYVWHSGFVTAGNTDYLKLESTMAKGGVGSLAVWNSTTPSSTVFSLGSYGDSNPSGETQLAYCFADIEGYSKAFSYTGNGSADGPYVHLGFKPAYILVKASSTGGAGYHWAVTDKARSSYNLSNLTLSAEDSSIEDNSYGLDITATGFKIRNTYGTYNGSGVTYIGFAIADVAGKYSLAR